MLLVCIFAYLIADVFLDLYKMTIDTIFLCFAEDCKHNNGKDKAYFMSIELFAYMINSSSSLTAKLDSKY